MLDCLYTMYIIDTSKQITNRRAKMNKTIDLGNNESASYGVFKNNDGTFTAMTFTKSKDFKTEKGAEKFMDKWATGWRKTK